MAPALAEDGFYELTEAEADFVQWILRWPNDYDFTIKIARETDPHDAKCWFVLLINNGTGDVGEGRSRADHRRPQ
jgi:hypothetical protein